METIEQLKQRIAELEKETEAYQKEINDFCNKRRFGCIKDADKKLTELEEKCKWQDKEIELDGEKLKQAAEEFNKQHELLDQYELECTDEIVRLKNQKISELEAKLEEVEGQYAYECECNKQLVELQEENAKLQEQLKTKTWEVEELMHERKRLENDYMKLYEQLKNAILPKFKIDDEVYHIRSWSKEIIKAKVNNINVYIVKGYDNFEYGLREWCEEDKRYQSYVGDMKDEELVFATEAEAQKYLEGRK